jgi:hypothetical protein
VKKFSQGSFISVLISCGIVSSVSLSLIASVVSILALGNILLISHSQEK